MSKYFLTAAIYTIALMTNVSAQSVAFSEDFSAKVSDLSSLGFSDNAFWTIDTLRGVMRTTTPGDWAKIASVKTPVIPLNRRIGDIVITWKARFPTANSGPSWRENNKIWLSLLGLTGDRGYKLLFKPNRRQDQYTSFDLQLVRFEGAVETELSQGFSHRLTPSGAAGQKVSFQLTLRPNGGIFLAYDAMDGQGSRQCLASVDTSTMLFANLRYEYKTGIGASNYFIEVDEISVLATQSSIDISATTFHDVYEYEYITLDARKTRGPVGSLLRYKWRQILGDPLFIPDSSQSLLRVLARAAGSIQFQLEVSDGAQICPAAYDTVNVTVHSPQTVSEFLDAVSENKAVSDRNAFLVITAPTLDPTFSTNRDTLLIGGTADAQLVGKNVQWTARCTTQVRNGSFTITSSNWEKLKVPLHNGENWITLLSDNQGAVSFDRIIVYKSAADISELTVSPQTFWIDSTTTHTFAIPVYATLIQRVDLLRLSGESVAETIPMNDMGTGPDAEENDAVYSGSITTTPRKDSLYRFQVRVTRSGQIAYSAIMTISPVDRYTPAMASNVLDVQRRARQQYVTLEQSLGKTAALDSTAKWLMTQPFVSMAGVAPGGQAVCWQYENGICATITDAPPGTKACTKYRAKGLSPFYHLWNSGGHDLGSPGNAYDMLKNDTSCFVVDSLVANRTPVSTDVNVESFKNWDGYQVVLVSTHGNVFGYDSASQKRWYPSVDTQHLYGKARWAKTYTWLATSQILDSTSLRTYLGDLTAPGSFPRLVVTSSKYDSNDFLCVTPSFLANYDPNLNGALLFLDACYSSYEFAETDGSFWNVLKDCGAAAMLGNSSAVYSGFSADMGRVIFSALAGGDSLGQAFDSAIAYSPLNGYSLAVSKAGRIVPSDGPDPARSSLLILETRNDRLDLNFRCCELLTGCWSISQTNGFNGALSLVQNQDQITGFADFKNHPDGTITGSVQDDTLKFLIDFGSLQGNYAGTIRQSRREIHGGKTQSNTGARASWTALKEDCN